MFTVEIEFELGGANGVYKINATDKSAAAIKAVEIAEDQDLVAGVVDITAN